MLPEPATVVSSVPLTDLEQLIEVRLTKSTQCVYHPGQFMALSIDGVGESSISIACSPTRDPNMQFWMRRVGNVTRALADLTPGSELGVRGPFGRGFPINELNGRDLVLVAGGLGLAPLRSLIQYILDRRKDFGKVSVLLGAKRPEEVLFRSELKEYRGAGGLDVHVTVDRANEGWTENVGVVTVLFSRISIDAAKTSAVVVGPPVMYKFVLLELLARKLAPGNIYVSLERRMKCGIAKCGHCQINKMYVCQDGPVFTFKQIRGLGEAI